MLIISNFKMINYEDNFCGMFPSYQIYKIYNFKRFQTIIGKRKFTIIFPEHGRNDEGVAYSTPAAEFHKTKNR